MSPYKTYFHHFAPGSHSTHHHYFYYGRPRSPSPTHAAPRSGSPYHPASQASPCEPPRRLHTCIPNDNDNDAHASPPSADQPRLPSALPPSAVLEERAPGRYACRGAELVNPVIALQDGSVRAGARGGGGGAEERGREARREAWREARVPEWFVGAGLRPGRSGGVSREAWEADRSLRADLGVCGDGVRVESGERRYNRPRGHSTPRGHSWARVESSDSTSSTRRPPELWEEHLRAHETHRAEVCSTRDEETGLHGRASMDGFVEWQRAEIRRRAGLGVGWSSMQDLLAWQGCESRMRAEFMAWRNMEKKVREKEAEYIRLRGGEKAWVRRKKEVKGKKGRRYQGLGGWGEVNDVEWKDVERVYEGRTRRERWVRCL